MIQPPWTSPFNIAWMDFINCVCKQKKKKTCINLLCHGIVMHANAVTRYSVHLIVDTLIWITIICRKIGASQSALTREGITMKAEKNIYAILKSDLHKFNYPKKHTSEVWKSEKAEKKRIDCRCCSLNPQKVKVWHRKYKLQWTFFFAFPYSLHLSLSRPRMIQTFKLDLYKAPLSLTRKIETQEHVEGVLIIDTDLMSKINEWRLQMSRDLFKSLCGDDMEKKIGGFSMLVALTVH